MSGRYKESIAAKIFITSCALFFIGLTVVLPLCTVFYFAFKDGFEVYINALTTKESISAIKLTLLVGVVALLLNSIFGIAIAWAIGKFDFAFKRWLVAVIDLPFTISPVIAGMVFILLFGGSGVFGELCRELDIKIVFSTTGIILATVFVTLPFVARSLISLMSTQGREEEEAAATLGAGFWVMFWKVTLPSIKWALLYGAVLCFARAIGDFGAVTVVAGPLRTVTIEIFDLYNEYKTAEAFAVASVLTMVALVALAAKKSIEKYHSLNRGER